MLLVFLLRTIEDSNLLLHAHRTQPQDRWSAITKFTEEHPTIPVAVDSGVAYLQMIEYGAPEFRNQLIRVIDPDAAVRWGGTDTGDKIHRVLGPLFAWRVEDAANFLAAHRDFVVLLDKSQYTPFTWLPQYLIDRNYQLTLLWDDNACTILRAQKPSTVPDIPTPNASINREGRRSPKRKLG